jgi:small subunit ribosomal protein S1
MSDNTDSAQNESPTTPSDEGTHTATAVESTAATSTATEPTTVSADAATASAETTSENAGESSAAADADGGPSADAADGAESAEGSETPAGIEGESPDGGKRRKRDRKRGKKDRGAEGAPAVDSSGQEVRRFKTGDALRARIVAIGESSATVDLWGKEQATIDLKELLELGEKEGAAKVVGDSLDVTVIHDGMRGGSVIVSCDPERVAKGRAKVKAAFESGEVIEGLVTGMNKGGLEIDVFGVRGFCPSSQIDVRFPPTVSPKSLVGQKVEFKITSIVDDGKEAIVSRRALMEASVRARAEELKAQLKPGDLVKGIVISVKEYGVFLDLNGIEGLIHLTEMSHNRSARPSELFKVGDEVEAKVLKITSGDPAPTTGDRAEHKHTDEPAATEAPSETPADSQAETTETPDATPATATDGGDKRDGREGKRDRRDRDRERRREPGPALPRVMLSRKAVEKDPWEDAHKQYPVGSVLQGKVARMQPFGAFIELTSGLDGLLHVSELGQGRRIENPEEVLTMGQAVTVKVERVDRGQRRIALSLLPDGMTKEQLASAINVRVGMIVKAKVVGHEGPGLHAEIEGAFGKFAKGYLHEKDSAQPRGADLKKALPVGTMITVKVLEIDRGRVKLSVKDASRDEERQAYKNYQREANKTTVGTSLADKLRGKLGDLVKR